MTSQPTKRSAAHGRLDARRLLKERLGQTVYTISRRRPNRILALDSDRVIVGTEKSPSGQPVPIDWVQSALDLLSEQGEIEIAYHITGHRGAFIGAFLASLPGAEVLTEPRRVRLRTSGADSL